MGRQAKTRGAQPWYRKGSRAWYVTIEGRQVRLGMDEAQAFRRWHELAAGVRETKAAGEAPPAKAPPARQSLGAWAEAFLAQLARRVKRPRTHEWYALFISGFVKHAGAGCHVTSLTRHDADAWLMADAGWSSSTRRGGLVALRKFARWVASMPDAGCADWTAGLAADRAGVREEVISEVEYASMLAYFNGLPFRKCLEFSWETGCRPRELLSARLEFLDAAVGADGALVFPRELSKGGRDRRVVYLSPAARALVDAEIRQRGHRGPLFLNSRGAPWTAMACADSFYRLHRHLLAQAHRPGGEGQLPDDVGQSTEPKLPRVPPDRRPGQAQQLDGGLPCKKRCLTHIRHSFVTRALKTGLNTATVAALVGHRGTAMVSKVSSHLALDHGHLSGQLKRLS